MHGRTVLLIDYEPRSIEEMRRPLEAAGFRVEVAHDGVRGIDAFERLRPDLVLVEAMLPKKHGFDVCQTIKSRPEGRSTPVVIMTAIYRGRKYRDQAFRNFLCDDYLEKPVTDERLLDTCRQAVERLAAPTVGVPAIAIPVERSESPEMPSGALGVAVHAVPQTDAVPAAILAAGLGPAGAEPADPAAGEGVVLELESMTEEEISDRLDALLSDFGAAIDRVEATSAPAAARTTPPAALSAVEPVAPVHPAVEHTAARLGADRPASTRARIVVFGLAGFVAVAAAAAWWFVLREPAPVPRIREASAPSIVRSDAVEPLVLPPAEPPGIVESSEPIVLAPPATDLALVDEPVPEPVPESSVQPEPVRRPAPVPVPVVEAPVAVQAPPAVVVSEIPAIAPLVDLGLAEPAPDPLRIPPMIVERGSEPIAVAPRTAHGDLVAFPEADTAPVLRERVAPVYHPLARERGEQGTVEVGFVIDESGKVSDLEVVEGSGYRTLDDSALAAVRRWKYTPATKDGVPVKVRTSARLTFQR